MSRRHSDPGSKPITTRLHKLTALLDELAKAPHQPEASDEFLPTKLLKRVLGYVGSGGAAAATNHRWRRVAANPELWRDAVQRAAVRAESRETADGRARQQAKDVILSLRAASRALAATPGSRIAELRDAMAAAASTSLSPLRSRASGVNLDVAAAVVGAGKAKGEGERWVESAAPSREAHEKASVRRFCLATVRQGPRQLRQLRQ